ncbi:MAG TPA: deaminase [Ignavibacteriaceae bacterium]|nr:deaminase [Ignavibacteriaceae bacterium]
MKPKKKFFGKILLTIAVLCILIMLFKSELYRLNYSTPLIEKYKRELAILGEEAVKKNDLPVTALLIYKDRIIGRGYNTVISDSNLLGHAELNAIADAIKDTGYANFMKLDRSSMRLLTTSKPCPMCTYVLQKYGIENVEFLKSRSLTRQVEMEINDIMYEFNMRKVKPDDLQDSLLQLYPNYTGEYE